MLHIPAWQGPKGNPLRSSRISALAVAEVMIEQIAFCLLLYDDSFLGGTAEAYEFFCSFCLLLPVRVYERSLSSSSLDLGHPVHSKRGRDRGSILDRESGLAPVALLASMGTRLMFVLCSSERFTSTGQLGARRAAMAVAARFRDGILSVLVISQPLEAANLYRAFGGRVTIISNHCLRATVGFQCFAVFSHLGEARASRVGNRVAGQPRPNSQSLARERLGHTAHLAGGSYALLGRPRGFSQMAQIVATGEGRDAWC